MNKKKNKVTDKIEWIERPAIAFHNYGFELTGCELDYEYYNFAIKRIKNHVNQQNLFLF